MMNTKQIFISHGDKGGTSKSTTSALVTERLLAAGHRVTVVEADPTVPDILVRYKDVPAVTAAFLSLNHAGAAGEAVGQFASYLEQNDPEMVVVNLPAGASETIDSLGDLLRSVTDELGYDLRVVYSLDVGKAAAVGLGKSFSEGLLSFIDPDKRVVNYPEYKGRPEAFAWFSDPRRAQYEAHEIAVPELPNRQAFSIMDRSQGRIADLAANGGPGWMVVDRLNVARWLPRALAALGPLFPFPEAVEGEREVV